MTFDEYDQRAIATDVYGGGPQPIESQAFMNKLLGLAGESGEVADKFKKIFRNKDGVMSEEDRQEIVKELGDVLWYLSAIAQYLGLSLGEVAERNLAKLADRKDRDVIKSKGDNR